VFVRLIFWFWIFKKVFLFCEAHRTEMHSIGKIESLVLKGHEFQLQKKGILENSPVLELAYFSLIEACC
jgi:hypothetical protein